MSFACQPLFLFVLMLVMAPVITITFTPIAVSSPIPIIPLPVDGDVIANATEIIPIIPITSVVVSSVYLFPLSVSNIIDFPTSVLVKDDHNIVVVAGGSNRVVLLSDNGYVDLLAGNGDKGNATFGASTLGSANPLSSPFSAVLMDTDTLLFTDTDNDFVKKLTISNNNMENFVGSGNRTSDFVGSSRETSLFEPKGMAFANSILYVTSQENRIFRVDVVSGSVKDIEITNGVTLQQPVSLAISSNLLYICDRELNKIFRYNISNKMLEAVVGSGDVPTVENDEVDPLKHTLNNPQGIALSPDGKMLYIADTDWGKIKVFNTERKIIKTILSSGDKGLPNLSQPVGLFIHSNGTLYFTDTKAPLVGRVNLTSCDSNSLDTQCAISSCFGKLSNESSVCSGKGYCTKTDTCYCIQGFVGNQCQFSSSFLINTANSNYNLELGKTQLLQISLLETIINDEINFIWSCDRCGVPINNNAGSLTFNASSLGTYIVSVKVNHIQDGAIIRASNTVNFTIIVTPSLPIDNGNSTVNSTDSNTPIFDSIAIVTDLVKTIPLTQSQMIDSVITGFNIDTKKLSLINQKECNNCSSIISISWRLIYEERIYLSSDQVTTRATANRNSNFTSVSLNPVVNARGLVKLQGSTDFSTLSIIITNSNQKSMVFNHTIPVTSSIIRTVSNMTIEPNRGMGIYTLFKIKEERSNWKVFSADQLPLSFAVGIVYNNQTVRLTDFVPMGEELSTYLPFTKYMENNMFTDLVIFAKDNLANVQSVVVNNAIKMLRFYGTPSDAISEMKSNPSIAKVVPYDSSFSDSTVGYDQLLLMAMQNFTISQENPTNGIGSLYSLSEKNISTSISNLIIQSLDSYIGQSLSTYKVQKSQNGFVSSKMSDDDTKTILSTASNLVKRGSDGGLATKLSSLLVISSIPTLLGSNDARLTSSVITSSNINITYSSFSKETASASSVTNSFDSISFEADSILSQYSSFSTEVGISVVSFNGIVYPEINSTFATNAKDFTMYRNGNSMNLKNLQKPFSLTFISNNFTGNGTSPTNRVICKYWNETLAKWDTDGCTLKSFNLERGEIVCSCTHTTLFSAFVEHSPVAIAFEPYVNQFIGLYGTQIALGSVYLICAVCILIGLAFNANKQPVKSRFITPFLGMIALIIQSSLLLIVQRGVLISSTDSNDANSYLASTILSNVITIIVNTITLCAILTYLYQVMRFEFLKYFYNEISSMNDKVTASRFLHFVKHLISTKFYCILLIGFAFINLAYWTLWVILVRTNVISSNDYTQIVSISYTVAILFIGFAVCCIFTVDLIMTWYQRNLNKNTESNNHSNQSQKMKAHNILGKIYTFLFSWFVQADSPLFFRAEMILFVISFIFLVIVQALGMASLNYRLLLNGYTETKLAPLTIVRTIVTYDSVAIIFEVLHIVTYMFVYGGYSLLVLIIQSMKKRNAIKNEQEKVEINQHLENPMFLKIFDSFCRKEFSLENLQLYLFLTKNSNIMEKGLAEILEFVENIYEEYVKSGSIKEVNIPSDCRKSFASMVYKLKSTDNLELVDEKQSISQTKKNSLPANLADMVNDNIKSLTDQILINLSDTFSRFFYTQEFEEYSTSNNSREDLMKQSNLM